MKQAWVLYSSIFCKKVNQNCYADVLRHIHVTVKWHKVLNEQMVGAL